MTKLYVLQKKTWADFDIAQFTPIAVSADKKALRAAAADKNAARSKKDIDGEISYSVADYKVDFIAAADPLDGVTKHDLAMALADCLDGSSSPHEIVDNTGLSKDRAREISGLFYAILPYAKDQWRKDGN